MDVKTVHIAVDVMGGDHGPSVAIPATILALKKLPQLSVSLFGDASSFIEFKSELDGFSERIACIPCEDQVLMTDPPAAAIRSKQQSSLYKAIEMIKDGQVDGCVSAGNTGAVMALAHHLLETYSKIDRPAVCAEIPTDAEPCLMLDLGANVDCSAEQLLQFGLMGAAMYQAQFAVARPTVGLLNIGEELGKGNRLVKEADSLIKEHSGLNYSGFVEADAIFSGAVNVVVCDGFVGNSVLKAIEGVARLIAGKIARSELSEQISESLSSELNPSSYNGATFLGLRGVVVASHGNCDKTGFCHAVELACQQASGALPAAIEKRMSKITC